MDDVWCTGFRPAELPPEDPDPVPVSPRLSYETLENALNVNIIRVADPVDGSPMDVVEARQLRTSIEALLASPALEATTGEAVERAVRATVARFSPYLSPPPDEREIQGIIDDVVESGP